MLKEIYQVNDIIYCFRDLYNIVKEADNAYGIYEYKITKIEKDYIIVYSSSFLNESFEIDNSYIFSKDKNVLEKIILEKAYVHDKRSENIDYKINKVAEEIKLLAKEAEYYIINSPNFYKIYEALEKVSWIKECENCGNNWSSSNC